MGVVQAVIRRDRHHKQGWFVAMAVFLACLATAQVALADIRVCTYNLLQFGSSSTTRFDDFRTVLSAIDPDVIVVQEITNVAAVNAFRDSVLNAVGGPGGAGGAATYTAADFDDNTNIDQALFFRDSKVNFTPGDLIWLETAPRRTYRWRIVPDSDQSGANDLFVYSMHLAASNPTQRDAQAVAIRNDTDNLPAGTHFILVGDFNIDSSFENSYESLTGLPDNSGRSFDPLDMAGSWHVNSAFSLIHTQSPCTFSCPGSTGGMDDRFDFILISNALQDGAGLDYIVVNPGNLIEGTYTTFGNDGNHFNTDLTNSPTIPEGAAMATALKTASDHLPVYLDLQDPISLPVVGTTPANVIFGVVIQGAVAQQQLTVTNTAPLPALDLNYSFTPPAGFTAPVGNFIDPPGGGGNDHTITMLTAVTGPSNGVLNINNDSFIDPATLILAGNVLEHGTPSTDSVIEVLAAPLDFGTQGIGMFIDQTASVHNAAFNASTTATLEVFSHIITNDAQGRFSVVGFLPVTGIGLTPADFTVHFDDIGAGVGTHTATLDFSTRDDTTLLGSINLATITFNLSATVSGVIPKGDLDKDGAVDSDDIPLFVALLLDPGAATAQDRDIADMDSDTNNDGDDIQLFVDALLP